ncbi:hypothetical protein EDD11_001933 [Mortierella claussenii]|nr:hypothetical protein EDD11_001933 [Mortierella claussenii]
MRGRGTVEPTIHLVQDAITEVLNENITKAFRNAFYHGWRLTTVTNYHVQIRLLYPGTSSFDKDPNFETTPGPSRKLDINSSLEVDVTPARTVYPQEKFKDVHKDNHTDSDKSIGYDCISNHIKAAMSIIDLPDGIKALKARAAGSTISTRNDVAIDTVTLSHEETGARGRRSSTIIGSRALRALTFYYL